MVYSEYQRLLEESARAREAWSNLRYEVCWAQLIPKKTIHKLLRLQAKYARAYTLLQKHLALLRAMRSPAENCIVQTNERQILYRGPATFLRKVCLHYVVKGGTNVHLWPSGMRILSSANCIG